MLKVLTGEKQTQNTLWKGKNCVCFEIRTHERRYTLENNRHHPTTSALLIVTRQLTNNPFECTQNTRPHQIHPANHLQSLHSTFPYEFRLIFI